jgi:6,7-dimethyl-8-ribityllumazine synthase
MNQMLQDPQDGQIRDAQVQDTRVQDAQVQSAREVEAGVPAEPPVRPEHPRFAKPQRVAFVQSSWHRDVVMEARIAFLDEIEARHIPRERVDLFEVPGSFEIPLHAQLLAKTRRYTAIVAAGLVVDGGIYRHEFVADTVIKALMDVQLRTEVPVFSAVLTPQQFHESQAHFEFFRKHFATKGIEVAEACANTLLSLERLRGQVAAGIMPGS